MSVRPHGTTRVSLAGFLCNLIFEYFSKINFKKFKFRWSRTITKSTFIEHQCTFLVIRRSIILRMRNVSDKMLGGPTTHFSSITFFVFENLAVYEIMWKNIVEPERPQVTIWRIRIACWIPKATNAHTDCVTLTNFPPQQY